MAPPLRASIVIPTRDRPGALRRCLQRLAAQEGPAFETIVVLDGPDGASAEVAATFAAELDLTVIEAERRGIAFAKNRAVEIARGGLLLLLNDDVLPAPGFVGAHVRAHEERGSEGPAMVVGHSPWVVQEPDTLFALLLRSSSMIFFYDRMIDASGRVLAERDHDWGFRHAWNLNCSVSTEAVRAVGGFAEAVANCCYEDVELAYRITRRFGAPVLFRPEAEAAHDHPYTPRKYLDREHRLGYSALGFALASPEAFGLSRPAFRRPWPLQNGPRKPARPRQTG